MKKLISLVTAGMLAMSLAACGSSGSGSAAAGGSSASSEPTTVTVYCMSFNNIPEDSEVTRIENLMNDYLAKTYPDDNIAIDIKLFGPAEYTRKFSWPCRAAIRSMHSWISRWQTTWLPTCWLR